MLGGKIRKLLGFRSGSDGNFMNSVSNIASAIGNGFGKFIADLKLMQEKSKNLAETNFKLGKKYYDAGNFSEAAFRFKILTKFWPEYYEGYFMLAQSFLAQNKFKKAEKVLNNLLLKKPAFKDRVLEILYSDNLQTR